MSHLFYCGVADADNDTYIGANSTETPTNYSEYTVLDQNATCTETVPLDCDDNDPNTYTGAAEMCDGVDNDCDGQIDEGNVCPSLTYYCDADTDTYISSTSSGTCDSYDCVPAGCTTTPGLDCQDNDGAINPGATEMCDGVDNNCDGQIDEIYTNLGDSCSAGIGACYATGSYVCNAAMNDTECSATPLPPGTEICNNIDDNCDGTVDEGLVQNTANQQGMCSGNTEYCVAGNWTWNATNYIPVNETMDANNSLCDGLDNDCDGQVDENLKSTFYHDPDNDTFGNDNDTQFMCFEPMNHTSVGGDNCPFTYNPDQADADNDGIGDACEAHTYITATVFNDVNGNGVQDGNESGVQNTTVTIDGVNFTTDSNGQASYYTESAGTYLASAASVPGYFFTTPHLIAVAAVPGNDYDVAFGISQSNSSNFSVVTGTVFEDINGNGVQDATELGLSGVTVNVDGTDYTTNTYGGYSATITSNVVVVETDPSGYFSTTPNTVHVSYTAGQTYEVNFGDLPSASSVFATISGTVFEDVNGNGVQDAGEAGISGVTVTVGGVNLTTNMYGAYQTTATAGTIQVIEHDPSGYFSTTPNTVNVPVTVGNTYTVDFGDAQSNSSNFSSVNGVVFEDSNGNGLQDAAENGISGVNVNIDGTDYTTDAYGAYGATVTGSVVVEETDPSGYFSTTPNTVHVPYTAGTTYEVNFGDALITNATFAVISGTVYEDTDGDGAQDAGEAGISGVTVSVDGMNLTTDMYGSYHTTLNTAGTVSVVETDPSGYFSTTPNTINVPVMLGNAYTVDFGDAQSNSSNFSSIYGTVFEDVDGDGIQDVDESGIAGVTVTVDGVNVTTNQYGGYSSSVMAGSVTVEEFDPAGYFSTTSNSVQVQVASGSYEVNFGDAQINGSSFASVTGTVFDDVDADGVQDASEPGLGGEIVMVDGVNVTTDMYGSYATSISTGQTSVEFIVPSGFYATTGDLVQFVAAAGQNYDVDFGAAIENGTGNVGSNVHGTVFDDANGDGVQFNESGIAGVTVTVDGMNVTTDSFGRYATSTAIGTMVVEEHDLPGWFSTTPNTVTITTTAGASSQVDFGDAQINGSSFASVTGTVFDDVDADGVQDAGEQGLSGVIVSVDGVNVTTGMHGSYSTSISAGQTSVEFIVPPGYYATTPDTVQFLAASGQNYDVDFGATSQNTTGNVHGIVFDDANGDGVQFNESGIAGVTVTVDGMNVTTDVFGRYATSVSAGTVLVEEFDPVGYFSTTPNSVQTTVTAGASSQVDFGDAMSNGSSFATIHGTVFEDTDYDGVRDLGEVGLSNVTVSVNGENFTTDTNGAYRLITNASAVEVVEFDPVGYFSTSANTVRFSVALGNDYQVDFADAVSNVSNVSAVTGVVFEDANGDGYQQSSENGLSGVTVSVDGNNVATDGFGRYLFTSNVTGAVTIEEFDPVGYFSTTPNTLQRNLALGSTATADFGDAANTSAFTTFYGFVFDDGNKDGVFDASESPLSGVNVSLGNESMLSDANGYYVFSGNYTGNFTIMEKNLAEYTSTTPDSVSFVNVTLATSHEASFGDTVVCEWTCTSWSQNTCGTRTCTIPSLCTSVPTKPSESLSCGSGGGGGGGGGSGTIYIGLNDTNETSTVTSVSSTSDGSSSDSEGDSVVVEPGQVVNETQDENATGSVPPITGAATGAGALADVWRWIGLIFILLAILIGGYANYRYSGGHPWHKPHVRAGRLTAWGHQARRAGQPKIAERHFSRATRIKK